MMTTIHHHKSQEPLNILQYEQLSSSEEEGEQEQEQEQVEVEVEEKEKQKQKQPINIIASEERDHFNALAEKENNVSVH